MKLGIVCRCEGLLQMRGDLACCSRCQATYPMKDIRTIFKLIAVADYQPTSAAQKPPTEEEKHNALTAAVRKLIRLKLKVMDLDEVAPPVVVPPPAPDYAPMYRYGAWTTTTSTAWGNSSGSTVYVRVGVV